MAPLEVVKVGKASSLRLQDCIVEAEGSVIEVSGKVYCSGDCIFTAPLKARSLASRGGDIEVQGSLRVKRGITVRDGSLIVAGDVEASSISVDRSMRAKGAKAEDISVGRRLKASWAEADIMDIGSVVDCRRLHARSLRVRGYVKAVELRAESLDVGGAVSCSHLAADSVDVGGSIAASEAEVYKMSVGNTVEVKGMLKATILRVGGGARVGGGEVEKLSVGGALRSSGSLKLGSADVGGALRAQGKIEVNYASIGGLLEAEAIDSSGKISVGGFVKASKWIKAGALSVGGAAEARYIMAKSISATSLLSDYARAELIEVKRRGRACGTLVADEVYLEDRVEADVVYAGTLEAEEWCTIREAHASHITLGDYTRVLGPLEYTEELKLGSQVKLATKPRRVGEIKFPKPPELGG